jgi:hypothetical protein
MGDIAEMMLDGTLCEQCGTYMGNAIGYPRVCRGCNPAKPAPAAKKPKKRKPTHIKGKQ